MWTRIASILITILFVKTSSGEEDIRELKIVEPIPNQIIRDKNYVRAEWILDENLGFNHHFVSGLSLCVQIESATIPSTFAPYKRCYSLCNIWPSEIEASIKSATSTTRRFQRYYDAIPSKGIFSFKSMIIDGTDRNKKKPDILAVSKPFVFVMDVAPLSSSDLQNNIVDPCEDSEDKGKIGGNTAFCSKLRDSKSGNYISKYFHDASPRICLGPIDIRSNLLLENDIVKHTGVLVDTMCLWTDLFKYFVELEFRIFHATGVQRPGEALWLHENIVKTHKNSLLTISGARVSSKLETLFSIATDGEALKHMEILWKTSPQDAMLLMLNMKRGGVYDAVILEGMYSQNLEMMTDLTLAWKLLKLNGMLILRDSTPDQSCESRKMVIDSFLNLFSSDDGELPVVSGAKPIVTRHCGDIFIRKYFPRMKTIIHEQPEQKKNPFSMSSSSSSSSSDHKKMFTSNGNFGAFWRRK